MKNNTKISQNTQRPKQYYKNIEIYSSEYITI